MNRWQHFYDLAAAQLAVAYAQTRNFDAAQKEAAARRMAADAKAFADAFKATEEAAFEPKPLEMPIVSPLISSPDGSWRKAHDDPEPTGMGFEESAKAYAKGA